MARVCPWWMTYTFDNFLRKKFQNPEEILAGLVMPDNTVMDIGCGFGYFSIGLAKMVGENGRVISVDIQQKSLDILQGRAEKAGIRSRIEPYLATRQKIGYQGNVDFVLTFWMVHEVKDKQSFFREIAGMLKPGGQYLFAEPIFHVRKKSFLKTVEIAKSSGLNFIENRHIAFSYAALFKRS